MELPTILQDVSRLLNEIKEASAAVQIAETRLRKLEEELKKLYIDSINEAYEDGQAEKQRLEFICASCGWHINNGHDVNCERGQE